MTMPHNVFDFSTALESCHAQKPLVAQVKWVVPADLPYLKGHFPQMPVMPAVAIIDASIVLIQQSLQKPELRLKSVKQAKFMSPLTVGDEVMIEARQAHDGGAWAVDWKNAEGQFLVRLTLVMALLVV